MPKTKSLRSKATKHQTAPKLKSRLLETESNDLTESLALPEIGDIDNAITKKEKRLHKREAFQEYVTDTLDKSLHSKSAQRRAKRREKERLAADLSDMGAILRTVIQDQPLSQDKKDGDPVASSTPGTKKGTSKSKYERGMIGESTRAKPLTKQQKKQALKLEQRRLPLILSHPQFMKDSFGAIRTHTANVLARATASKGA